MKKKLGPLLRILFSLGLMALLYRKVSLQQLHDVFSAMKPAWLVALYALLFINTAISSFKWRQLLLADKIDIPLHSLIAKYLIASFFSMFLPSNIGGDAYRVYAVAKKGGGTARSFASVLADRLSGFIAVVLLGFFFCIAARSRLPDQRILLVPVAAFLILCTAIGILLKQSFARRALNWRIIERFPKLQKFGHDMLDSVLQYRRSPGLMFRVMAISFVFQFNMIVCLFLLSRALGLGVPFHYFCMFVPIVTLFEALPISIYGIGVRDASYVYFYGSVGLAKHEALSLAIAYLLTTFIYCASGGILFMLRRDTGKKFQPLEKA